MLGYELVTITELLALTSMLYIFLGSDCRTLIGKVLDSCDRYVIIYTRATGLGSSFFSLDKKVTVILIIASQKNICKAIFLVVC